MLSVVCIVVIINLFQRLLDSETVEVVHHIRTLLEAAQGAIGVDLRAWIQTVVGEGDLRVLICITVGGLFLVLILSYAVYRLYQVCELDVLLRL